MDATLLQEKIYGGYAKAALRIGQSYTLYRPGLGLNPALNPITDGNIVTTLAASFNAEDMTYRKPNAYGRPLWWCLVDGTQTQVGDYLVYGSNTFYIAAMQPALPILAVQCNRIVNLLRPQQSSGAGVGAYGGDTAAGETSLMTGWPASILQGAKGDKSEVNLPGDARNPWWNILLPFCSPVQLRSGDVIIDDISRRYIVSSAELTDLGWRITAMQAQT